MHTVMTRTNTNLLAEAAFLTDNDEAYGALILARAIGREISHIGGMPYGESTMQRRLRIRFIAREYSDLLGAMFPTRALASRRIVVIQDAAEVAFGA